MEDGLWLINRNETAEMRTMNKHKIFNDPVYGFVSVPYGLLFDLVEHPFFQRLRRIKQVSLTHYVYPGALHTRFQHALGALHLMGEAIEVLRGKGVEISPEEAEAASAAILLHDIGHGPFSHTLEHNLIKVHHEALSSLFMDALNDEFGGRLDLAIQIFKDGYHKNFLHQLVSGQLDMDRMDYLNRDSFFTGVHEGVIGYDRIIKMLDVHEGDLVVEEKGIYSIEKFLIARRLMYWQVYLHKTVLCAEQMLVRTVQRARSLAKLRGDVPAPESLRVFLYGDFSAADFLDRRDELLGHFAALDDYDVVSALKAWRHYPDFVLSDLSARLIDRRLFKLEFSDTPFEAEAVERVRARIAASPDLPPECAAQYFIMGAETNSAYSISADEIYIKRKSGQVLPLSEVSGHGIQPRIFTKYYLCYPKHLGRKDNK